MFRVAKLSSTVCARTVKLSSGFPSVTLNIKRNFSETLTIPSDKEQQAGRRKEELDAEEVGAVGFNRDPIVPAEDAGTKENPILVPSGAHSRAVGYEDPYTHQLVWFNLDQGPLHYVPDIGLYFKLAPINAH